MVHTLGIVLNAIKYRETSLIVRIFTEALGLQSYLVQGVRAKNAKHKAALFQPMTVLDMVVHHRPRFSLQRIVEAQVCAPVYHIINDVQKGSIALFMTELLVNILR